MSYSQTPQHPGALLRQHIINPLHWSDNGAAAALETDVHNLSEVLDGLHPIDPELAQTLEAHGFGQAQAWLFLQERYDAAQDSSSQQAA